MKLNIVKVLNNIAAEEATVMMLTNPDAFWNCTAASDIKDEYEYYREGIEMDNDSAWEMIEWLEKHGMDYSHWTIKKVLPFDEWLENRNAQLSKYLVAA